jgi:hypothetical protein
VKIRIRPETGGQVEVGVDILPRDPTLAAMVQDRIGDKLSLGRAKANLFGQSSLERVYRDDLDHCMSAAERACRSLNLDIVHKQVLHSRGRLEARDDSGRAARFTLKTVPAIGQGTEAVVTTEGASEGGEKDLLDRIVREFERDLVRARE